MLSHDEQRLPTRYQSFWPFAVNKYHLKKDSNMAAATEVWRLPFYFDTAAEIVLVVLMAAWAV